MENAVAAVFNFLFCALTVFSGETYTKLQSWQSIQNLSASLDYIFENASNWKRIQENCFYAAETIFSELQEFV